MAETETVHATCVAIGGHGVLLMGRPGAGKSSLALQLIDQPGHGLSGTLRTARLVADDQVVLQRRHGAILASAPTSLAGLIEIRGVGVVRVPVQREVQLVLAARLTGIGEIERLPDAEDTRIMLLGVMLPMVHIDASLAAAPARLRAAIDLLEAEQDVASQGR